MGQVLERLEAFSGYEKKEQQPQPADIALLLQRSNTQCAFGHLIILDSLLLLLPFQIHYCSVGNFQTSSYFLVLASAPAYGDPPHRPQNKFDRRYLAIADTYNSLEQVSINQKEILKQIPVLLTVPITKEGQRIEAAIAKSITTTFAIFPSDKSGVSRATCRWGYVSRATCRPG
ncbi:hypothetical protein Tco_0228082 [Tanacetum coccineum]